MGKVNKHQEGSPKNPPDNTVKVGALAYIGQPFYPRGYEVLRVHLECIMDITITISMPTKALQKLGRLPAPVPTIKKDPKSKPKPKLKITASSRITRQTSLSRSDLPPPPEMQSRASAKKGRARAASSLLTSPVPSSPDSPRSDDIVEMRAAGSEIAGSEVADLIARCEREETEIDRLLVEIESQCSDE
jgi:hypothetical protein